MKKIIKWFANIPADKLLHFGVSAMITIFASHMLMHINPNPYINILSGMGFGLLAGVLKEIYDNYQKDNKFSWSDMLADVLGCITGGALVVIPFI